MGKGHGARMATLGSRMLLPGLLIVLITTSLSAFLSNQARQLWLSLSDPYNLENAIPLQKSFESGSPITILYTFIRHRYCETDLDVFLVRMPENDIVWRLRTIGGATSLGTFQVKNTFTIPEMPAGNYEWRTTVASKCSDGLHSQAFPEASFDIAEKGR
jgi:hypothetical protein